MGTGFLKVTVNTAYYTYPIPDAAVVVMQGGQTLFRLTTDADGAADTVEITAPDKAVTLDPYYEGEPYAYCDIQVEADGFAMKTIYNVKILDTETTLLPVHLTPVEANDDIQESVTGQEEQEPDNTVYLPEHNLPTAGERPQEHTEEYGRARQRILREVIIPNYIVVHLGRPATPATNVTVSFKYYIKNVCSHEIYSTWPEAAIEANVICQISLALNRIYTETRPLGRAL